MRVLIVEDDENKRDHLAVFLRGTLRDIVIECAASYNSGVRKVIEFIPELILLDMTLPTFDITAREYGGASELYGGRDILEQMDYRDIHIPVIVLTQFDRFGDLDETITLEELDRQLAREYGLSYKGAVYYDSAREGWKSSLKKKMLALNMWEER